MSSTRSAMSFKIGDRAVHPEHGVGEVLSIEKREIAGTRRSFYIIKISESGVTVMVPTDGAERVGLRPVMSAAEANQVFDELRRNEVAVISEPWSRRYKEYSDLLKSGSPVGVAKVLRDLSRLRSGKELSFGDRRLLDQARSMLVAELALARRCREERIREEIDQILV